MSDSVVARRGKADRCPTQAGRSLTGAGRPAAAGTVQVVKRRNVAIAVGVAVALVAGTVLAIMLVRRGTADGPECSVTGIGGAADLDLTAVQLQHASTINAVGVARSLPIRARVIALATAWQESTLRNLDHGDRDSIGLFQQRPSQGWGSVDQIMDPVYASGKFYDALVQVPDWQRLPLTRAAQAVQYSGYPEAYAKWEPQATALANALGGLRPVPALRCRAGAAASTAPAPVRSALPGTQAADPALRAALAAAQAELGGLQLRDLRDAGRSAVLQTGQTGAAAARTRAASVLAAWAVAHATGMGITRIEVADGRYADHSWIRQTPAAAAGEVLISVG